MSVGLRLLLPFLAWGVCALGADAQQAKTEERGHHENYRQYARRLAERSDQMITWEVQCRTDGSSMAREAMNAPPPKPLQLFDNFYYVGAAGVGSYLVKTSAGLILIDALGSSADAEKIIVPGIESFGLHPVDLKYVIVSHGHGDHYGGAQWLAEKYGARVVSSEADWQVMGRPAVPPPGAPAPNWSPAPKKDLVAADGQKLTLGSTTITTVITPGHTPGTISVIVPISVDGEPHMLAIWGGTGIGRDPVGTRQYVLSVDHFESYTEPLGVDAEISNHPFVDDGLARMEKLRANPKGSNPFIIGKGRYADYMGILKFCAMMNLRDEG